MNNTVSSPKTYLSKPIQPRVAGEAIELVGLGDFGLRPIGLGRTELLAGFTERSLAPLAEPELARWYETWPCF